jgi:hypothetical protein
MVKLSGQHCTYKREIPIMTNMIPSFLSGSRLKLVVNNRILAYASNLSVNDRVSVAPVTGLGSYMADALEPLSYTVSGSFVISVYDQATLNAVNGFDTEGKGFTPNRAVNSEEVKDGSGIVYTNGHSFLNRRHFSPIHMMIQNTFDIEVYERTGSAATAIATTPSYRIMDVRLTGYSMSFTPGSLIQENLSFIALRMEDVSATHGSLEIVKAQV